MGGENLSAGISWIDELLAIMVAKSFVARFHQLMVGYDQILQHSILIKVYMKGGFFPLNFFVFGLLACMFVTCTNSTQEYYISIDGKEDAAGTKSDPFRNFTDAQQAIRKIEKEDRDVRVWIAEGIYYLAGGFRLSQEDSGHEDKPVVWSALPGENVVITGGIKITDFKPLELREAVERIDRKKHKHILEVDLRQYHILDYGNIDPRSGNRMELFFDHTFMDVARFPNEGWLKIAAVPQSGLQAYVREPTRMRYGVPVGRHFGRFKYDGDRPGSWKQADDVYMHGYWVWDWSDEFQRIDSIDKHKKEIYPALPYHRYGYHQHQRYYFVNVLEELDRPGEWYLDKQSETLFFWPPANIDDHEIWLSIASDPLWTLGETSHIRIEHLSFHYSRGEAIHVVGGRSNQVIDCDFRNLGKTAIVVEGGVGHSVRDCDFSDLAMGGIEMEGGDRRNLTPGRHVAENNYLHHFAQRIKTYQPAIRIRGVGDTIAHNLIHDAPHMAVGFSGNDHIIEYNEIHHVLTETSDAGAIYNGRDWTQRGTEIRYNYFHDLGATLSGEGFHGVMGIYLDDCLPGTIIRNNIFRNIDRAIMLGGGKDNKVYNNVFIDCDLAIHVDARAHGWAKRYAVEGGSWQMHEKLAVVDYQNPPWSSRYPSLVHILQDPFTPTGIEIERNICQGGQWLDMLRGTDFSLIAIKRNVVAADTLARWQTEGDPGGSVYLNDGQNAVSKSLKESGNTLFASSEKLVEIQDHKLVYNLEEMLQQISFEAIPLSKIGLVKSTNRQSLP